MSGVDVSRPEPGARWLYAWGGANVAVGASSLLVPLYVVQLGGDAFALGVLWFATSMAMVPGALVVGRFADRNGRRRATAVACLAGLGASLAAIPVANSVAVAVVGAAAMWLCVAGVTPILTLMVLDGAPEAEWSARVARLNRYQDYGWTAGLAAGTVWTLAVAGVVSPMWAQRVLLAGCALGSVASAAVAARWLPADSTPEPPASAGAETAAGTGTPESPLASELAGERARDSIHASVSPSMPNRFVWLVRTPSPLKTLRRARAPLGIYFLAVSAFFAGFAAFSAPLPDFLAKAGFGDGAVFGLYVVASLASAASYGGASVLADRYDLRTLQSGALAVRGVVFPAVAVAGYALSGASLAGGLAVGALFVAEGLTWAVVAVTANTLVARYAGPTRRSGALGLYTALSSAAGGVGGLVGGWLATALGYVATFAVAGGLVFVGCGMVLALRYYVARSERSPPSTA